jgi:hypothetical protein
MDLPKINYGADDDSDEHSDEDHDNYSDDSSDAPSNSMIKIEDIDLKDKKPMSITLGHNKGSKAILKSKDSENDSLKANAISSQ